MKHLNIISIKFLFAQKVNNNYYAEVQFASQICCCYGHGHIAWFYYIVKIYFIFIVFDANILFSLFYFMNAVNSHLAKKIGHDRAPKLVLWYCSIRFFGQAMKPKSAISKCNICIWNFSWVYIFFYCTFITSLTLSLSLALAHTLRCILLCILVVAPRDPEPNINVINLFGS